MQPLMVLKHWQLQSIELFTFALSRARSVPVAGAVVTLLLCCSGSETSSRAQTAPTTDGRPLYVRQIAFPAKALAYDSVTKKLFASLPSTVGAEGNSVIEIDPVTAQPTKPFFVGSEPNMME